MDRMSKVERARAQLIIELQFLNDMKHTLITILATLTLSQAATVTTVLTSETTGLNYSASPVEGFNIANESLITGIVNSGNQIGTLFWFDTTTLSSETIDTALLNITINSGTDGVNALTIDYLGAYSSFTNADSLADAETLSAATATASVYNADAYANITASGTNTFPFDFDINVGSLANDGNYLLFRATSTGAEANGDLYMFDSTLTVTQDVVVVPEPSSLALLGLGGLALITRRKR